MAAVAVFTGACAIRFIGVDFTNDDLLFLAIGRQIAQFGEWPVRDLFEEGDPLHNVASAVLQLLTGHSLVGEALFDIVLLAFAAALVTALASRWLRSAAGGALAGALTVIAWPRLYDYPKAVIPAAGLWLCDRYQHRPSRATAAVIGLTVGLSFLLRHDFGVYVAVALGVGMAVSNWSRRTSPAAHLALCGAVAAAVIMPYLAYVQAHVGIVRYVRSAQRFTQREVSRSDDRPPGFAFDWSRPVWEGSAAVPVKVRWGPTVDSAARRDAERRYSLTHGQVEDGRTWKYLLQDSSVSNLVALVRDPRIEDTANIDRSIARGNVPAETSPFGRIINSHVAIAPGLLTRQNAVAWLYHFYLLLPWLAVVAIVAQILKRSASPTIVRIAGPTAFCVVAAPLLLRGNLYENSRLADFTTPAVMLAIACAAAVWSVQARRGRIFGRSAVLLAVTLTAWSIWSFGEASRRTTAILMLVDRGRLREEQSRLWQELVATPPSLDSIPREGGVRGAVEYLRECTAPLDRVLVFGFLPDVLYYSGRGAAADRAVILRGFGTDPDEERTTIAAMNRHPAAVAIVETNRGSGSVAGKVLDGLHPILEDHLASRYARVETTSFGGSTGALFDVWVNRRLINGTTDARWCRS